MHFSGCYNSCDSASAESASTLFSVFGFFPEDEIVKVNSDTFSVKENSNFLHSRLSGKFQTKGRKVFFLPELNFLRVKLAEKLQQLWPFFSFSSTCFVLTKDFVRAQDICSVMSILRLCRYMIMRRRSQNHPSNYQNNYRENINLHHRWPNEK